MTSPGPIPRLLVVIALLAVRGPSRAADGERSFPPGFLWGTATAAHQVEGGNTKNDWSRWEQQPGRIRNGERSGQASDHFHRYPEDLDRARALGSNSYRFSIEWSRIEPQPGVFDAGAIDHYRQMIQSCRSRGLVPMVTLFHFTQPLWFADAGGFEKPESVEIFARFAARMGQEYGGLVDLWNTQNEPVVWLLAAYGAGLFPPGKTDPRLMGVVAVNLLRAHAAAYRALHRTDTTDADGDGSVCRVGIAKHLRVFEPARPRHPADLAATRVADGFMNWLYLNVVTRGHPWFKIPGGRTLRLPAEELAGTLDFIGFNYYSRDLVRFDSRAPGWFRRLVPGGAPVSDMGWEIYPEGVHQILGALGQYRLPIYITENGLADAADEKRVAFLHDHLRWIHEAIEAGVDVRGYFHWSLIDNFEWHEGYYPRFGLYQVDYATQARTLTAGAEYFSRVAHANALVDPGEPDPANRD